MEQQLGKFEAEMENDGVAQRSRIRELLANEQHRAEAAVASSLQLSNLSNLTPYVFGGDRKTAKELPIASVRLSLLPVCWLTAVLGRWICEQGNTALVCVFSSLPATMVVLHRQSSVVSSRPG